jgi:hypothetical protein
LQVWVKSVIPAPVHPFLISFTIPLILLIIGTYLIWLILTSHHLLQSIIAPGMGIGITIIRSTLGKRLYLSYISVIWCLDYYTKDHRCHFSKLLFCTRQPHSNGLQHKKRVSAETTRLKTMIQQTWPSLSSAPTFNFYGFLMYVWLWLELLYMY